MKKRIFEILNVILGLGIMMSLVKQFGGKKDSTKNKNDKMTVYYQLMNKWMKLREENRTVSEYMEKHGFETIAIYGLGDIGRHLEKELKDSKITVLYAIDRIKDYLLIDLDVYSPESELPPVDAVIVTPVMEFDNIHRILEKKISCPILSMTDVVNELSEV